MSLPLLKIICASYCSRDNVLNPLGRLTGVHNLTHQVSLTNAFYSDLISTLELHHNRYICVALQYF